jgi:hypothetical protein
METFLIPAIGALKLTEVTGRHLGAPAGTATRGADNGRPVTLR